MSTVDAIAGVRVHAPLGALGRRRMRQGYGFVAPAVLFMLLFVGVPLFFSLYLSMSNATIGVPVARFVGFQNFVAALRDPTVRLALRNTVEITVIAGVFKALLGGALAFLLMQEIWGKKLIRTLILLPWTLPTAITALTWLWMFDSQFSAVNRVAIYLHLMTPASWVYWLGPQYALASVVITNIWRGFPFAAVVLLAGLTAVPPELLDAAKVDGAHFLVRFHYIIVPVIAPILFIGLLFDTVFTLSDISIVFLMTRGGPVNMTEILATRAYEVGITGGALGEGAAVSLLLFPLLLPVVYFLLRLLQRREAL